MTVLIIFGYGLLFLAFGLLGTLIFIKPIIDSSAESDKQIADNKNYRSARIANLKARGCVLHPARYAEGIEVYCWPELTNVNAINSRSEDLYIRTYANGR